MYVFSLNTVNMKHFTLWLHFLPYMHCLAIFITRRIINNTIYIDAGNHLLLCHEIKIDNKTGIVFTDEIKYFNILVILDGKFRLVVIYLID